MMDENEAFFSKGVDGCTLREEGECMRSSLTAMNLFSSQKLTDVNIDCRGERFTAHKLVLSLFSPYFRDIFLNPSEGDSSATVLLDCDPRLFESCLKFMYNGTVDVMSISLHKLTELAEMLCMQSLEDQGLKMAYQGVAITHDNCLLLWTLGIRIRNEDMSKEAKAVALTSFGDLQHEVAFTELSLENVRDYLSDGELATEIPEERLMSAVRWVKAKPDTRLGQLPILLLALPLSTMRSWSFKQTIKDPLLKDSPESITILQNASGSPISPPPTDVRTEPRPKTSPSPTPPVPIHPTPCLVMLGALTQAEDEWERPSKDISILPLSLDRPCRTMTTMPAPVPIHGGLASCSYGPVLYVSGLGPAENQVWAYHVTDRNWTACGETEHLRWGHCMAVCNGGLYIIGGSKSIKSQRLVTEVERLDLTAATGSSWQVVGNISGTTCGNVCCIVRGEDLLVFGAIQENTGLLQAFSTTDGRSHTPLELPSMTHNVSGMVPCGDKLVLCDAHHVYIYHVSAVYGSQSSPNNICSKYDMPNNSGVVVGMDGGQVVFVRENTPTHHGVYTATAHALVTGSGPGWSPIEKYFDVPDGMLFPGTCSIMYLMI